MSAEPSLSSTSESTDSDAWMEELLLAGLKATVKPSLSADPISSRLIAEPPIPTWAADDSIPKSKVNVDKIDHLETNLDFETANTDEPLEDSPSACQNLEMNHPLVEDQENQATSEQDRLIDDVFHGLNEPIAEPAIEAELETPDPRKASDNEKATSELDESEEKWDPVAAEIAQALKEVEEEAAPSEWTHEANDEEELAPVQEEISPPTESVVQDQSVEKKEPASPDQNESLSQEAISSLLAKFDDEDDLPPTVSAPKEPAPKVSCPAGTPQPKINLAAIKKKSGDEAPALAARLFGEGEGAKSADGDRDFSKDEVAALEEKPKERRLPAVLMGLDGATDRLRKLHPTIPAALGILGGFLLLNGILTAVLASLGWI